MSDELRWITPGQPSGGRRPPPAARPGGRLARVAVVLAMALGAIVFLGTGSNAPITSRPEEPGLRMVLEQPVFRTLERIRRTDSAFVRVLGSQPRRRCEEAGGCL